MASILTLGGLALVGCARPVDNEAVGSQELSPEPESDDLRASLDDALLFTYQHRHLNLADHAAWQILHGVLTYKEDFLIRSDALSQEKFPAVLHILDGGEMKGWTVRPGDMLDGRRGFLAELESGSGTGQGHYDQWLAVLAQCDLPSTREIHLHGQTFTMEDYVYQVLWDIPNRRLEDGQYEYSWTLIGLTTYLPTDYTWPARDGQTWSIEQLVEIEAQQAQENLAMGACGGTHRLIGLAMALNQHVAEGGEVTGVWQQADEVIQNSIATIRQLQNPDGSLSEKWLERPGVSPDIASRLRTTGHQLEFLSLAMSKEELQQPWVKRAVANLCQLFEVTQHVSLECGALYHAAHGLALYREHVYGPLAWTDEEPAVVEPATAPGGEPPLPPDGQSAAAETARRGQ